MWRRPWRRVHWELFEGVTSDDGTHWSWTPVTADSRQDNLRPKIATGPGGRSALLWMRGTYAGYQAYDTVIVGIIRG